MEAHQSDPLNRRVIWQFLCEVGVAWCALSAVSDVAAAGPTVPLSSLYSPSLDSRPGYLESVNQEKEPAKDIIIHLPPAARFKTPSITDKIFNQKMTEEFRGRYEQVFGRTSAERVYILQANPFEYQQSGVNGFQMTAVQTNDKQKEFGDYMARRLVEFHADNWFRNDPEMKVVYEVKERISKGEVEVRPGYNITAQFNLGGNYLDLVFKNPYVESQARMELNSAPGGKGQETTVSLRKQVSQTVALESHYTILDGIAKVIARKSWGGGLETSLLGSTYTKDDGYSIRQSLGLAGIVFVF